MTFEEFCQTVDMRKVEGFVAGFGQGTGIHEKDRSDEAFVAMLLGVKQEAIDGSWWFRGQINSGAECEIHYAMYVDEDERAKRKLVARDFVDSSKWTAKQERMVRDILSGWLEDY